MKGIRLIFATCLAPLAFHGAIADDVGDAARRTSASTVVSSTRQKSNVASTTPQTTTTRATNLTSKTTPATSRTIGTRTGNVVPSAGRGTTDAATPAVTSRATSNVQSRTATTRTPTRTTATSTGTTGTARTAVPAASRTATSSRAATTNTSRGAVSSTARRAATATNISRAAVTADEIMNRDYKKCREVYYDCMDEFCANKDSQLKRCACSSRVNEFDKVKQQLSEIDDKMLDFNQRLLTVNMDKEDAVALFKATEGELAFNQKDTSDSKKMLDEITKKLNTTFDSSNFDQNLSALSWSLNADAAFDSVDSMLGASTTSKTGTDLYAAALPVCREMALEVCTEDELEIATSGYQMVIEQDCNTVAKSYSTQTDAAREKIREGSALLDMSRLDIYQKRNSDDILTCKKKMLDMLTDSTVCGTNLGKCLDTTGRYIDPSTGEAFLTVNLADLGSLITRPGTGETWTGAPGNDKFISYLNSKKKYLEPAMENCQDISDYVWDEFIEDALAQIKLAQESKLEEMRQSCTTLTTQCLSDTADSLADFDARALSTFGVAADKTVNAMCADIRNACTALLDATGGGDDWQSGMTEIANDKTYETIMQTCREVGRACIIQACKSISGNFGLCENIQTSVNRKAIINRTSCWKEVQECVASAGAKNIDGIMSQLATEGYLDGNRTFYSTLYGNSNLEITNAIGESGISTIDDESTDNEQPTTTATMACQTKEMTTDLNCVYDICATECGLMDGGKYDKDAMTSTACSICRLSEKIWGNCEVDHITDLSQDNSHNRIRTPINNQTTLMYWFATNTGTDLMDDSCRDTSCGIGYKPTTDGYGNIICRNASDQKNNEWCLAEDGFDSISVDDIIYNCCKAVSGDGEKDTGNNSAVPKITYNIGNTEYSFCCHGSIANTSKATDYFSYTINPIINRFAPLPTQMCLPSAENQVILAYPSENQPPLYLICLGEMSEDIEDQATDYPKGKTKRCNGKYMIYNALTRIYFEPKYTSDSNKTTGKTPVMFYDADYTLANGYGVQCVWNPDKDVMTTGTGTWTKDNKGCSATSVKNWQIMYK